MSNEISKIGVEYVRGDVLFTVDGEFLESYNVDSLFSIDEATITLDMATHSAKFGRIAVLLARAERYESLMKQRMEVEYATADSEIRDEYKEMKTKYTEPVIKAEITMDEVYKLAVANYDEASNVVYLLKNLVNALKVKGDMLISIGAQLRAEMSMTGMHITDEYDKNIHSLKETLKNKA